VVPAVFVISRILDEPGKCSAIKSLWDSSVLSVSVLSARRRRPSFIRFSLNNFVQASVLRPLWASLVMMKMFSSCLFEI
jgi:hypothetical protein